MRASVSQTFTALVCLLLNQHCVSVAEESVCFADRFIVGTSHEAARCKCADKHHEGGAWHVKVCQQTVDCTERKARLDKKICRATPLPNHARLRCRFERAHRRRTDGDDAASSTLRGTHSLNRLG